MKYRVLLARAEVKFQSIEVEANSDKEARKLARIEAANGEWCDTQIRVPTIQLVTEVK